MHFVSQYHTSLHPFWFLLKSFEFTCLCSFLIRMPVCKNLCNIMLSSVKDKLVASYHVVKIHWTYLTRSIFHHHFNNFHPIFLSMHPPKINHKAIFNKNVTFNMTFPLSILLTAYWDVIRSAYYNFSDYCQCNQCIKFFLIFLSLKVLYTAVNSVQLKSRFSKQLIIHSVWVELTTCSSFKLCLPNLNLHNRPRVPICIFIQINNSVQTKIPEHSHAFYMCCFNTRFN